MVGNIHESTRQVIRTEIVKHLLMVRVQRFCEAKMETVLNIFSNKVSLKTKKYLLKYF